MLLAPSADGCSHLVSCFAPTSENRLGYHRLAGGSVEVGETHRETIIREVDEELGASILDLTYLGMIENIFRYNGELGHEIVALHSGTLDPAPADEGGTLTESDGSLARIVWRPFDDADVPVPLYPSGAKAWISGPLARIGDPYAS